MLGLVRTTQRATISARRLLTASSLLLLAATTAALLQGGTARAATRHAPASATWGQHVRATPNPIPSALPPMSANLQPVPLPDGRTVLLHLPPRSYRVHPLIFALHGLALSPAYTEYVSNFDALADRSGYIIAYGVGIDSSWNAGTCCGSAVTKNANDVDYLAEAVTAIESHFAVDQARIIVTGFSNGGMLAFRAACERPDLFRAALTVAGPLVTSCPHPVTVTHVHGTLDSTVPLTGGYSAVTHSSFPDSRTEASRLPRGSHEKLVLWRGGHDWPVPSDGVDVGQLLVQLVG